MILKLVLVLIIFSFVVYVLKAIARLAVHLRSTVTDIRRLNDQVNGRAQTSASAEMVRCAACGSFVSGREAITISSRGRAQTFCSHDCIRAHVKTA